MSANPWDKFFWNDWENDPALKLCSLAAQGLWMRILCICAKADPKGYLVAAGRPLSPSDLSSLVGKPEPEIETLLRELGSHGVYSTDRIGRIYNRRMVLEESLRRLQGIKCATGLLNQEGSISWSKVKAHVIERDGKRCIYCGTIDGPFEIDHITPKSRGGSNSPKNLTVACLPCNRSKGARTPKEWLQ